MVFRSGAFLTAAFLAVSTVGGLPAQAGVPSQEETSSSKAINFEFTDIEGKRLRLSDFKGKWLLVNFWAPWCPLCWVEVPALNELNKRKDFAVVGIGLDYGPDENAVRDTAARHNINFAHVVAGGARRDPNSPFRQVGPVDFYPTSYLYDPTGEIVMFIPGQVRMNKILAFMEERNPKNGSRDSGASDTKLATQPSPGAGAGAIKPVSFERPRQPGASKPVLTRY